MPEFKVPLTNNIQQLNNNTENWTNWKWQLKNRLDHRYDIRNYFPNLSDENVQEFKSYCKEYNFAITPYLLSLIELDDMGNPCDNDPIWSQFKFHDTTNKQGYSDYDHITENWEDNKEMPTPILHQKYPGRAIIRLVSNCIGYCNYCYLTKRILDESLKSK